VQRACAPHSPRRRCARRSTGAAGSRPWSPLPHTRAGTHATAAPHPPGWSRCHRPPACAPVPWTSSPRELLASPSELSASPSELSASPRELLASPSELLASPSELLESPSELLASPSELLASPRELLASPRELSASPRELLASPPSKILLSPSKGIAPRAVHQLIALPAPRPHRGHPARHGRVFCER
jgi:hypothetical protein